MRHGGGSLAKIFPAAGELGRSRRELVSQTSHFFLVGCSLEDYSFGEKGSGTGGGSLQTLSPRGYRDQGRRPKLLCWARAHFSGWL